MGQGNPWQFLQVLSATVPLQRSQYLLSPLIHNQKRNGIQNKPTCFTLHIWRQRDSSFCSLILTRRLVSTWVSPDAFQPWVFLWCNSCYAAAMESRPVARRTSMAIPGNWQLCLLSKGVVGNWKQCGMEESKSSFSLQSFLQIVLHPSETFYVHPSGENNFEVWLDHCCFPTENWSHFLIDQTGVLLCCI